MVAGGLSMDDNETGSTVAALGVILGLFGVVGVVDLTSLDAQPSPRIGLAWSGTF